MNGIKLLLSLSLSGSAVLLALLAFQPLLRRLGKTWQYYIWLVVAARLLLPAALPVNLMGGLFPAANPPAVTSSVPMAQPAAAPDDVQAFPPDAASLEADLPAGVPAAQAPVWLRNMLPSLWAAAALALLVRKLTDYGSFVRFVRAGLRPADENLQAACLQACEMVGLRGTLPVYVNPLIPSPMLVGLVHPFIVAPDEAACGMPVLLHELTHRKRLDAVYKWIVELAVCVHWFNPLVYVLRRTVSRACELSCDEAVLRLLAPESRVAYGDALLEAARAGSGYQSTVAPVTLKGEAKFLKERLAEIMRFQNEKRPVILPVAMAALVTAGALVCGCAVLAVPRTAENLGPGTGEKAPAEENLDVSVNAFSGKNGRTFNTTFFKNRYIIEMEWNMKPSEAAAQREIVVDGASYKLLFTEQTKQYADNEAVRDALAQKIRAIRAKDWHGWGGENISSPVIKQVGGPYSQSAGELAEKFHNEQNLPFFSAVAGQADQATQTKLAEEYLRKDEIPYFSIVVDGVDDTTRARLLEEAYDSGKTAQFSMLTDGLPEAECARLAKRAFADERVAELSMLADNLGREDRTRLARQAFQEGRVAELSILADGLGQDECAALARQAFAQGDVAIFSNLCDVLSDEERTRLARQAYEKGDVAIFSVLADELNETEQALLARRAFKDGNIALFSMVMDALGENERAQMAKQALEERNVAFYYMLTDDE